MNKKAKFAVEKIERDRESLYRKWKELEGKIPSMLQSCKMSFLLHGWKYELRILPKKRVNCSYLFLDKTRKSSIIWVNCRGVWGKITPIKWFFYKDLHSVKNAYVTPMKFTPDLQIFYTFPVFGLNVQVSGGKLTPNK